MKSCFLRTLALLVATLAMFMFAYPDDPSADDAGDPDALLMESSDGISAQVEKAVDSSVLLTSGTRTYPPPTSSKLSPMPESAALASLATCVLRC
jgi:hypothetical protein